MVALGESRLSAEIREASGGQIEASDIDAQLAFIRNDLGRDGAAMVVRDTRAPDSMGWVVRGRRLSYHLTNYMAADALAMGVTLKPIAQPGLHAKLLAWDDNCIVVTSLNRLSADTAEFNIAKALGVCIEAPGVGHALFERFSQAM